MVWIIVFQDLVCHGQVVLEDGQKEWSALVLDDSIWNLIQSIQFDSDDSMLQFYYAEQLGNKVRHHHPTVHVSFTICYVSGLLSISILAEPSCAIVVGPKLVVLVDIQQLHRRLAIVSSPLRQSVHLREEKGCVFAYVLFHFSASFLRDSPRIVRHRSPSWRKSARKRNPTFFRPWSCAFFESQLEHE